MTEDQINQELELQTLRARVAELEKFKSVARSLMGTAIRERDSALAERDGLRRNLRESFEAMCAMRDSINEYLPMPSLESDLLQGPETSIFCATVAEAVVDELARRGQGVQPAELVAWRGFIDFVKNAPVSSGVCCCGESMENHSSPMYCGHSPVDQWDYSLSKWLESLAHPAPPASEGADHG